MLGLAVSPFLRWHQSGCSLQSSAGDQGQGACPGSSSVQQETRDKLHFVHQLWKGFKVRVSILRWLIHQNITQLGVTGCCQFPASGIWPFHCHLSAPAGGGGHSCHCPPFTAVLWRRVQGKHDLSSKPVVNCVLPPSFSCVSQGQICYYLWIKEAITLLLGSGLGLPCHLVLEAWDWALHYEQEKYQHSVVCNRSFSHVICLLIHIYIELA